MKTSRNKPVGKYARRLLLVVGGVIALQVVGIFTVATQNAIEKLPDKLPTENSQHQHSFLPAHGSFLQSWNNLTANYNISDKVSSNKSILIIGGSDGSGTRAFVDLIHRHFKIPFVHDDVRSFDIHGKVMFRSQGDYGWPPLVRSVLNEAHSANYNITTISDSTRLVAMGELNKLKDYLYHMFKRRNQRISMGSPASSPILFGFKAPVAMLLLPFLQEIFGSIRVVHVVRDGRDVSLNSNQSPVVKFYESYYGRKSNAGNTSFVQSMELWNDWNMQVFKWEQENDDGVTFEHLVLRTEDLVQHDESRLNLLLHLGSFLNVYPTVDNLCKIWKEEQRDLGVSVAASVGGVIRRHRGLPFRSGMQLAELALLQKKRKEIEEQRSATREKLRLQKVSRRLMDTTLANNVTRQSPRLALNERYGKWQELQQTNPDLLLQLEGKGAVGLEILGYKPAKPLRDAHPMLQVVLAECSALSSS